MAHAVGCDRIAQGITVSGGGGGGTTSQFLTGQTVNNGITTISHTLGVAPKTVLFFRSTGEALILQWQPNGANPTTQIDITNAMPQFTGVTIQLSA
jgi:hypothetical protein